MTELTVSDDEEVCTEDTDANFLRYVEGETKVELQPIHYIQDEEFKYIYAYLTKDELSGDDRKDKTTLLLADQYFIRNNILYRLKLRCNKIKQSLFAERICIPKIFRAQIVQKFHDFLGHFGTQRIFLSVSNRFYWKTLFS